MSDKFKCEDCAHFDDEGGPYGMCTLVDATIARGSISECGDFIVKAEKKCSSCKWFDAPGLCRRYAPRGGEWGATAESNWCGDYEAGGGDEG